MEFWVYILKCADGSLYVGCTNDLEKRVRQHNTSKSGAHYTKIRRPVRLVYQEKYGTLKEGRSREAQIKTWPRKKKLDLIKTKSSLAATRLRTRKKVEMEKGFKKGNPGG